jgi:hypothetical protein
MQPVPSFSDPLTRQNECSANHPTVVLTPSISQPCRPCRQPPSTSTHGRWLQMIRTLNNDRPLIMRRRIFITLATLAMEGETCYVCMSFSIKNTLGLDRMPRSQSWLMPNNTLEPAYNLSMLAEEACRHDGQPGVQPSLILPGLRIDQYLAGPLNSTTLTAKRRNLSAWATGDQIIGIHRLRAYDNLRYFFLKDKA